MFEHPEVGDPTGDEAEPVSVVERSRSDDELANAVVLTNVLPVSFTALTDKNTYFRQVVLESVNGYRKSSTDPYHK
ncbi:MAG: hypothetical protein NXI32_19480 [bacterium]|nr:hypothetical protein [bacterium]